jgi:hypothetical protein
MANRIKLAGTTANAFQIGLKGPILGSNNVTSGYQLNLPANVGANAQVLTTDGLGNLSWTTPSGGGGNGTPGGSNTQVQFNDDGNFGGNANFTFNKTTSVLSVTGNISAGNVILANNAGVVYVNNITGLAGQPVIIESDGTEDISLNADTIRIGDNNTDATIATHGTGDLILRTHLGSADEGNIIIRDGANGNIQLNPNGTGIVIANSAVSATGNVSANFFIGNGSQLTGLPASSSIANGNSNVSIPAANGNILFTANAANSMTITSSNVIIGNGAGGIITAGQVTATGNITAGQVTATGNITANFFIGNGSALTGLSTTSISNGNSNVRVFANANVTISSVGNANIVVVTGTGANVAGTLNVTGVVTLTSNANLRISGGSNGQVLTTDGSSNLRWANGGGGNGTALVNGNSNVIVSANSNITMSVAGVANLTTFTNANVIFGTTGSNGNITGANVITANTANVGEISITGNIGNANVITANIVNANTTMTVGNLTVGTQIIPQNSQSANYDLVAADSGKQIFHPSADTTARTFLIPANSNVAFSIGTSITFINQASAGNVTIAVTTDTMRLAGNGATGNRLLTANGIATCVKVTGTEWIISGVNLT